MANEIKKINVGGTEYALVDEYARQRIEGLATIYSISCDTSYTSSYTYYDYDTEATVAFSSMTVMNSKFKSLNKDITISASDVTTGTSAYIVLLITKGTNQYYVKKLTNLTLGDTIYVKEDATVCADRWLSSWTESPLSGTFTALDAKIDLSNYPTKSVAGKAGTYTTSDSSAASTGSAGAATITTSSAGSHTATGTASVTYSKSATATGSAGGTGTSANTGNAGAATLTSGSAGGTVNFSNATFTGTAGDISVSSDAATINDHTFTPAGTISAVAHNGHTHTVTSSTGSQVVVTGITSAASGEAGDHTHTVTGSIETHKHGSDVSASKINTYTAPSMTTITFTPNTLQSLTTKNFGFSASTSNVMTAPTVSNNVLSWTTVNAATQDVLSAGAQATLSGGVFSAGTLTYSAVTAAGSKSAETLSLIDGLAASAGAHSHTVTVTPSTATLSYVKSVGANTGSGGSFTITPTFTGTAATLAHVFTDSTAVSLEGSFTPVGTISGTQDMAHTHSVTIGNHSHTYTKPADHTHSITLTDATASGDCSVNVGAHTHTVTIANHSHTMGHTHTVTVPNCVS